MGLIRLTLMQVPSGALLFDKVWSWHSKEQKGSAEGICSLILALAKLSRDFGYSLSNSTSSTTTPSPTSSVCGSCLFDPSSRLSGQKQQHERARKTIPSDNQPGQGSQGQQNIKLSYVRREHIALGLFHDCNDDSTIVNDLLNSIGKAFETQFNDLMLTELKGRFEQIEKSDGRDPLTSEEMNKFASFDSVIEKIKSDSKLTATNKQPSDVSTSPMPSQAPSTSASAPPIQ